MFRGCSQGHRDGATTAKRSGHDGPDWEVCKAFSKISVTLRAYDQEPPLNLQIVLIFGFCLHALTIVSHKDREAAGGAMSLQDERAIGRDLPSKLCLSHRHGPLGAYACQAI